MISIPEATRKKGDGVEVPKEYEGREQSFLKHRILRDYLLEWGMKLGSVARKREVRLCYVDGFAGPWCAASNDLADTSIAIGLTALEEVNATWRAQGVQFRIEARFIEKDQSAYDQLEAYVASRAGTISVTTRHGEFGEHIPELVSWMGKDAALIFVDPTGWKGAAMRFIAPLVRGYERRDVLINLMYDHINRFKDDDRAFLREQMREFFGLTDADLPEAMSEQELFALYRRRLKEVCGVRYAADLAVPDPTRERTKFGIIVGGSAPAVLEVFRKVERKVMGEEAPSVLGSATSRQEEDRTGQLALLPRTRPAQYDASHREALSMARTKVLEALRLGQPTPFKTVWPPLLEELHLTKSELAQAVWAAFKAKELLISNVQPRERTAKDEHVLSLPIS